MAKKVYYENRLAVFRAPDDGWRHLAASVIERAITDADRGNKEAIDWLLSEAPSWAEFAGMNRQAVKDVFCKKYRT